MLIPQPGNPESAHVLDFCRHVAPDQTPLAVPYKPLRDKPPRECFSIVPEQVIAEGGKQLIGWSIWETPGIFIEAEFHAVWQDGGGHLIDITPRPQRDSTTLFLPDPSLEYRGRQVDNIRRALVEDIDVTRLIHLAHKHFLVMNKGDLADKHGELPTRTLKECGKIQKQMMQLYRRLARRYPGRANAAGLADIGY